MKVGTEESTIASRKNHLEPIMRPLVHPIMIVDGIKNLPTEEGKIRIEITKIEGKIRIEIPKIEGMTRKDMRPIEVIGTMTKMNTTIESEKEVVVVIELRIIDHGNNLENKAFLPHNLIANGKINVDIT